MSRLWIIVVLAVLMGCSGGAPQSPDAIQAAIHDHLASRGDLDMNEMGVKVESVRYKEGEAEADVTIGAADNPNARMQMRYTLRDVEGKWVVQKPDAAGAHGGAAAPPPPPEGDLPEGHPPVEQPLPEGHPPVEEGQAPPDVGSSPSAL